VTEPMTTAVQVLMSQATTMTSPGALLALAAEMTKPKSVWKGGKKLSRDEALAATRAVTAMLGRYGLRPTQVLVSPGRASLPAATGRFYLTRKEMEPGATVTKPLATGIGAHLANVRAIARFAREAGHQVDEEMLLGELAEAVATFLEPFRGELDLDPDAEIAGDVNRISTWLASPRRNYELTRFLGEAGRRRLAYDIETGAMEYEGEMAVLHNGNEPTVFLFTRVVGHARAEVFKAVDEEPPLDEGGEVVSGWRPETVHVGVSSCVVCQKVRLGVRLAPGGQGRLEMAFTLDPATYVDEPRGEHDPSDGLLWGDTIMPRYPNSGVRDWLDEPGYCIVIDQIERYVCPDFEAHHRRLLDSEHPDDEFGMVLRAHLPVTEDNCRFLLDGKDGGGSRFWRMIVGADKGTVLPDVAIDDAGCESRILRDRLASILYSDAEPTLASLLDGEAAKRTDAMEAYQLKSTTGDRRRKLAFRARMRR